MKTITKQTHTPGPWQVDSGMVQTEAERLSSGLPIPIAWMDREPNNGTMPVERDANAQLIAAAPELLSALKKFVEIMRPVALTTAEENALWQCEKAIDKAEGN